jgi:RHS repeat-associated protein
VSDPDGPDTVGTTYDSNGRVYTVSNPHRSLSSPTDGTGTYGYDGLDRKSTATRADGNVAYTYYGGNTASNGGLSAQKCSGYGTGYPVLTIDEAKNLRETWTDGFGRMIEVDEPNSSGSLASGAATCYAYDLNDKLIGVLQPGSESTCSLNGVTYNRCFQYDMLSRLTSATNPETAASTSTGSGSINYYYTTTPSGISPCSGDPTAVCLRIASKPNQANSSTTIQTTYAYDALNRLISKSYNDSSTPTVLYGYDAVNPTGCTPPALTITNGKARRTSMCDGSGATAWNYDQLGNKLTEVRKVTSVSPSVSETVSAAYNYDSSIASITYPSGRLVTYKVSNAQRTGAAYDSSNIYAQGPSNCPFNQSNGVNWACYTPSGQLDSLKNGSSLTTIAFYNDRLQPCRIAVNTTGGNTPPASCSDSNTGDKFDIQYSFDLSSLGTSLCSLNYNSYTNNGNVASITNKVSGMSGRSQQFCYDALNRIASAQTTGIYSTNPQYCWAEAYTIDAISNLWQIAQLTSNHNGSYVGCSQESGFTGATINSHNQDSVSCYDAAGNNVGASSGSCTNLPNNYWYDAENRICSYAGSSSCATGTMYVYDGDGNRVEKSSGTLYWYGPRGEVLGETNTSGSDQNEYVFFGGKRIARVDPLGNVFYYFADHLSTSRVIVQDGSTPMLCYDTDFYPYGGERTPYANNCPQSYKFTGKVRDTETNLDYFGARYYSSQHGRFMSPDWSNSPEPVPYADTANPQSLNLYAYVKNDPLIATDADGHCQDGDKPHGFWWCLAHAAGIIYTENDRLQDAANFFHNNDVRDANGNRIDPDKLSDRDLLKAWKTWNEEWQKAVAAGANPQVATAGVWTQWGWRGQASYNKAVKTLNEINTAEGTVNNENLQGKVPTAQEAKQMIEDAGGKVLRIEEGHGPESVSTHDYPHINYETASGAKGTIRVQQ